MRFFSRRNRHQKKTESDYLENKELKNDFSNNDFEDVEEFNIDEQYIGDSITVSDYEHSEEPFEAALPSASSRLNSTTEEEFHEDFDNSFYEDFSDEYSDILSQEELEAKDENVDYEVEPQSFEDYYTEDEAAIYDDDLEDYDEFIDYVSDDENYQLNDEYEEYEKYDGFYQDENVTDYTDGDMEDISYYSEEADSDSYDDSYDFDDNYGDELNDDDLNEAEIRKVRIIDKSEEEYDEEFLEDADNAGENSSSYLGQENSEEIKLRPRRINLSSESFFPTAENKAKKYSGRFDFSDDLDMSVGTFSKDEERPVLRRISPDEESRMTADFSRTAALSFASRPENDDEIIYTYGDEVIDKDKLAFFEAFSNYQEEQTKNYDSLQANLRESKQDSNDFSDMARSNFSDTERLEIAPWREADFEEIINSNDEFSSSENEEVQELPFIDNVEDMDSSSSDDEDNKSVESADEKEKEADILHSDELFETEENGDNDIVTEEDLEAKDDLSQIENSSINNDGAVLGSAAEPSDEEIAADEEIAVNEDVLEDDTSEEHDSEEHTSEKDDAYVDLSVFSQAELDILGLTYESKIEHGDFAELYFSLFNEDDLSSQEGDEQERAEDDILSQPQVVNGDAESSGSEVAGSSELDVDFTEINERKEFGLDAEKVKDREKQEYNDDLEASAVPKDESDFIKKIHLKDHFRRINNWFRGQVDSRDSLTPKKELSERPVKIELNEELIRQRAERREAEAKLQVPTYRSRNHSGERLRQRDYVNSNFAIKRAKSRKKLDLLELPESPVILLSEAEKELNPSRMLIPAKIDIFKENDSRSQVIYEILDWIKVLLIALIIGLFVVNFIVQRNEVNGRSMVPTLQNGDQLIVQKVSRYFSLPKYGDIITFVHPDKSRTKDNHLVKRVIGLPGDRIEIRDQKIYRNGIELDEPYLEPGTVTARAERGFDDVWLQDNQVYVLGDNRSVSADSRIFGPIDKSLIEGEIVFRIYPFNSLGIPR